jgi:Zn-dependent peptidase ImmA (M78 family)
MKIFESDMGMSKSLILPRTRSYQDQWRLEQYAVAIRERMQLTQFDILDPWKLADSVPAHVFYLEDVVPLNLALKAYQANWDGFAFQFPRESILMVILNSAKPLTRQSATLMEELSHGLLGHIPSRLQEDPHTGLLRRDYNKDQEREAYGLGATILLPKELIEREVNRGLDADEIALARRCSAALVEYRIKKCHLWKQYTHRQHQIQNAESES